MIQIIHATMLSDGLVLLVVLLDVFDVVAVGFEVPLVGDGIYVEIFRTGDMKHCRP